MYCFVFQSNVLHCIRSNALHCISAESEMFGLALNTQRLTKAAIKALDLFCTNMQGERKRMYRSSSWYFVIFTEYARSKWDDHDDGGKKFGQTEVWPTVLTKILSACLLVILAALRLQLLGSAPYTFQFLNDKIAHFAIPGCFFPQQNLNCIFLTTSVYYPNCEWYLNCGFGWH